MTENKQCNLQVIIVSGPEDISRAVLGFAFASAAAVSEVDVTMVLSLDGLAWAGEDEPAAKKKVNGFDSISEYMDILLNSGAAIRLCSTCVKNSCRKSEGNDAPLKDFPVAGLSELAVQSCNSHGRTVVF